MLSRVSSALRQAALLLIIVMTGLNGCTALMTQTMQAGEQDLIDDLTSDHSPDQVEALRTTYRLLIEEMDKLGFQDFMDIYEKRIDSLRRISKNDEITLEESRNWIAGTRKTLSIYRSRSHGDRQWLDEISNDYLQGRLDVADTKIHRYLEQYPNDDWAWAVKGRILMDKNDGDGAYNAFAKSVDLNPDNYFAQTGLGSIHQFIGNLNQAIERFKKALGLQPNHAPALSGLSTVYLHKGELSNALHYAHKAFELDNDNAVYAANLAIIYHYSLNPVARDRYAETAEQLGYPNSNVLREIFEGKRTILNSL